MVAAALMDDTVAGLIESCDGLESDSRPEPGMKLDAELSNRDAFVKELVDNLVLEAFNIHLQQIDRGIAILVHNSCQIPAVKRDFA